MPIYASESLWQRFWQYPFYQNALLAGLAIAALCSVLSVFVVLRRMAFIGQGISHAAFGGAGLALLLGLTLPAARNPLLRDAIIAFFCVGTALLIGWIARQQRIGEDSAIGICLAAAMAVGVILLDIRSAIFQQMVDAGQLAAGSLGYTPSFHDLLFGNILSIPRQEAWLSWMIALLLLAIILASYKELVFFAFDPEAAAAFGVRTNLLYYGLLTVLGITIVLAMRLLGVILATAMLILPGVAARFWSRRIGPLTAVAVICGLASVLVGLFLTIWLAVVSTAPVIVLTMCAVALLSYLAERVQRLLGLRRPTSHAQDGLTE